MEAFLSVYGHVTIDQIISVNRFPENNTSVDVIKKDTRLGGTGTNIAVRSASLGVPTALCSFVGRDLPKVFEDFIKDHGVITDELIAVDGMDTSQATIVNDSELDQKVLFYQGPLGSASELNIALTKNARSSKFVHFCTGEPDYYLSIMKEIRDGNRLIALDPAQEVHRIWNAGLFNRALDHSDMIFCNRFEAESIKRYLEVDSFQSVRCPLIVCTKGNDGCDAYIDGQMCQIPIIKADRAVDATGAGDAFRAGFYAGQYRGLSIEESLVTAASSASFAVEDVGALSVIPTWDMVMERADRHLRGI